ncbi:MAG: pyruvate, phosphate dikinase [Conexivisphaera sp.]
MRAEGLLAMARPYKYTISFREGDWRDKKLLGGKGSSLAQMTQMGLPVPPGFTITTVACRDFLGPRRAEIDQLVGELEKNPPPSIRDELISKIWSIINSQELPDGLMDEVRGRVHELEAETGKGFGNPANPLLLSVRSGAALSMPGMMDTVLNLGMNDAVTAGLAELAGNEWFAYDAYRRFLQMFGRIVLEIEDREFDAVTSRYNERLKSMASSTRADELSRLAAELPGYSPRIDAQPPREIAPGLWSDSVSLLKSMVSDLKSLISSKWGEFPQDPWRQLELAVKAVFRSWMNPRAIFYRMANNITPEMADCTAVNVVTMVFGNMGWDSGTGVYFTRNPSTGEDVPYGEFLPSAQGEDVVAGVRTPMGLEELKLRMPAVYGQLIEAGKKLERLNRDVMDIEFTVERGRLYFLQNRVAKMTPAARVKTAVDLANEGVISREDAVMKVDPQTVQNLLYPRVDPGAKASPIATGLPASPGAVSGQIVFHPDVAVEWSRSGKEVILVRVETKPDDVHGFYAAKGILTSRGGMTSHAAVVARAIGKPAVVGAESISVDYDAKEIRVGGATLKEGDWITIDGSGGRVYPGKVPTVEPEIIPELEVLLSWADGFRRLGVRANADVPEDAEIARKFGAQGIGLLRIERMFRKPERLEVLRKVILSEGPEERREPLRRLSDMIRPDFKGILEAMDGLPVVIRLIDPPLHEFLPSPVEVLSQLHEMRAAYLALKGSELARSMSPEVIKQYEAKLEELERLYSRVTALTEHNPMMGHRGVRVGVTDPDFYYYLTRAIMEATLDLLEEGRDPRVEIMIPQVMDVSEIKYVKSSSIEPAMSEVAAERGYRLERSLTRTSAYVISKGNVRTEVLVGTMVETVRATLTASEIAKEVAFFSFGTNDLTQATLSFSRDDVENKFLPKYLELGILAENPFQTIDVAGVGKLVRSATADGKASNPALEVGICGEHGGDPASIEFFHSAGLDYVSASPYRVMVARLAAARAALRERAQTAPQVDR